MTTNPQIRRAVVNDAEKITTLINAAFRIAESFFIDGNRISTEEVKELLVKGDFLVAEAEGTLTSCVYIETRDGRTYLGLLSVNPELQRTGLGSQLLSAAEDYSRQNGSRFMDIYVVNLREELPQYYQKRGYIETGTTPFPENIQTKLPCFFINMSKAL